MLAIKGLPVWVAPFLFKHLPMPLKVIVPALLQLIVVVVFAQKPTVGLTNYQPATTDVYTLFAPAGNTQVYLIDNCGNVVHSWTTENQPGQAIAITDKGELVHTGKIDNESFAGGGSLGGRIEMLDWNGTVKWRYDYSSPTHTTHHDMCLMPNGNILVMAWQLISPAEAIAAGRNPAYVSAKGLWAEQLIELKPIGADTAVLVWKWEVWDHLVQDYDSTKPNYGVVADNPDKINLNYDKLDLPGWVHINSVDYNAELNQVMVSSRVFGEVWIINHDTGVAGNSKSGLVFRYGNPAAYNRGTIHDREFFYQHNAHWVSCGTGYDDAWMVFNNGTFRQSGEYSTVEIYMPERNATGGYWQGPADLYRCSNLRMYNSNNRHRNFFSRRVSGAQMLSNGHLRVCIGSEGRFIELDGNDNIVWQYICPIGLGGKPVSQGSKPPFVANTVFNTITLQPHHPALAGRDLSPKGTIEINPLNADCIPHPDKPEAFNLWPLSGNLFNVVAPVEGNNWQLTVNDIAGNAVVSCPFTVVGQRVDLSNFEDGVYMVFLTDKYGLNMCRRFVKMPY